MIGNEEDFTASLGFEVDGVDENLSTLPVEGLHGMIKKVAATFPNLQSSRRPCGRCAPRP